MSTLIHLFVIVFIIWLLLGALPQMHRDAAARLPQVRGLAQERMTAHAKRARKSGRLKPAEWLGWGIALTAAEAARFGGYTVRSAWRGWGEHRRRAKAGVDAAREKWFPPEPRQEEATGPPRGTEPPDGGGGGTEPPEPSQEKTGPPQEKTTPEPVPAGTGNVIPLTKAGYPTTVEETGTICTVPYVEKNKGEKPVAAEINNLEAAVQVVRAMQERARVSLENAIQEKARTAKALTGAEQSASDLAAAGVTGPAWEAFVRYHEAVEVADNAAASAVTACEMAVQAADSARGALVKHEEAAEQLKATGGAADKSGWYGAGRSA